MLTTLVPPPRTFKGKRIQSSSPHFSGGLWRPCLGLGCILGSATDLLCYFWHITFPLWNSVFPTGNRPCASHSNGPCFSADTYTISLLSIILPSVSHREQAAPLVCNRSAVNVDEYIVSKSYCFLSTWAVSDQC